MSSEVRAEKVEGQKYVYGLSSSSIRNMRIDPRPCGVYGTNERILFCAFVTWNADRFPNSLVCCLYPSPSALVMSILLPFAAGRPFGNGLGTPMGLPGFVLLFISLGTQWYKDFSEVPIQELEKRKIWDIERGQIATLEMSESSLSTAQIKIHLKSGETRSILFSANGSYDHAKLLFSQNNLVS